MIAAPERPGPAPGRVTVVLHCADVLLPRVRYVFDTLFMAAGIPVAFAEAAPAEGPRIVYGPAPHRPSRARGDVAMLHDPAAWDLIAGDADIGGDHAGEELPLVFPGLSSARRAPADIEFDLAANAFYFLAALPERRAARGSGSRQLFAHSVFARHGIPQDIVDRYLARLLLALEEASPGATAASRQAPPWPAGNTFAVALSHDVDFLPSGLGDNLRQGAKTIARHLVRQRNPLDAARAGAGLVAALARGRDPHGCVPEIIEAETRLGVQSSFQVAVARRHPADVNYSVEDDRTRDYLRAITDAGFDLCLHGSYRSTENPQWYADEVATLARRLAHPLGSRQHYLSFDYDTLFTAQEATGIRYDMSMGFPDRCGSRTGFSYPYFPFDLARNRPYDVVELQLVLMDATLRGYMDLSPARAGEVIDATLRGLRDAGGAASVVWHPIVFGGARDPGYDRLYWDLVRKVKELGGWATDGRSIDAAWRRRARAYASFANA